MEERIHPQSNEKSPSKQGRGSYTRSRRSCTFLSLETKTTVESGKEKVSRLIRGKDGVVRGVILLHKGHTIERPLQLVCPLEIRGVDQSVHLQERRRDEVQPRNQRVRRPQCSSTGS